MLITKADDTDNKLDKITDINDTVNQLLHYVIKEHKKVIEKKNGSNNTG